MKKKISISIDEDILNRIDKLIDGIKIRNRSQAIEYITRNFISSSGIQKALILAGGPIESLRYKNTFKPLFKINGKEVILHTIEKLVESGTKKIYIASGHITNEISSVCKNISNVDISFITDNSTGTSGAVYSFKPYVKNQFIVVSGDIYFDIDLRKMIEFHRQNSGKCVATIAVTTIEKKHSKDSIMIEGDKIINFEYKPKKPSFYSNTGIYIFNPEIFRYLLPKGSLEKDVFPELAKKGKLRAYVTSEPWTHID